MCEKLHAFRSPLLELGTSGAGDLMKNMIKQIYFCGPDKLFLVSFKITPGWVKMLLYIFAYFWLSQVRVWRLLSAMERKWKPVSKEASIVIPMAFACVTCLGLGFGTSFRWTWGAAILLYMYRMVGWEAFVAFVTNLEYLFQLPPKLLLPWVCFPWGRGVDCMMSKKY